MYTTEKPLQITQSIKSYKIKRTNNVRSLERDLKMLRQEKNDKEKSINIKGRCKTMIFPCLKEVLKENYANMQNMQKIVKYAKYA